MKAQRAAIARRHLDARLARLHQSRNALIRPTRGWIRALRDALGMTAATLGRRMGISQAAVSQLEKGEIDESISLKTLRAAAEALECTLVYALIPRKPMEALLQERAAELAEKQLARTNRTMALENQALAPADQKAERQRLIDEILRTDLRQLWREQNPAPFSQ